jgi:putative flippase GtrA
MGWKSGVLTTARRPAMREFASYACAGAAGTALQYAVFVLAIAASAGTLSTRGAVWASTLGAVLGAGANYLLNHLYSFRSARPHREAAPRFMLVAATGLAINAATVGALCAGGLPPLAAQLVATAAVLVCGFLLNRRWTFG